MNLEGKRWDGVDGGRSEGMERGSEAINCEVWRKDGVRGGWEDERGSEITDNEAWREEEEAQGIKIITFPLELVLRLIA